MTDTVLNSLLLRQLRKMGLSENEMPKDQQTWNELVLKVNKTYKEYDEARMSSDNILAVSLHEMEIMQE
jgi:hypothetical protein